MDIIRSDIEETQFHQKFTLLLFINVSIFRMAKGHFRSYFIFITDILIDNWSTATIWYIYR